MAEYPRITVDWLAAYFHRWLNPGHGLVMEEGWQVKNGAAVLLMDMANDTTYPQGPRRFEVWVREVPPLSPGTPGVAPWTVPH